MLQEFRGAAGGDLGMRVGSHEGSGIHVSGGEELERLRVTAGWGGVGS